jgi:hypothetical protein
MSRRLRHCIECPNCRTRYLLGFSPYRNGSYVTPLHREFPEEWALFCSCAHPPARSRWNPDELESYAVSNYAYRRGYGSPGEITRVNKGQRFSRNGSQRSNPIFARDTTMREINR